MRASIMMSLLLVIGLAGCVATEPQALVQSALADTHLGWQAAPENQLAFSIATASGVARLKLRPLPDDLQTLTLDLPGMRRVGGVQWRGDGGDQRTLFDDTGGSEGVLLEEYGHGFRLQISGAALNLLRDGGILTVVDFDRG